MVSLCSVEFCFSPFFFSYLFLFRVYFVVTNDITILPASLVCITDCYQKWVLLKPLENLVIYNCPIATTWCRIKCVLTKIGPFKNTGYLIITKSLKFGFSLFCRVLLLALFFFVPVFISCLFRGDEWHNYFTSVISLYNRLLSKMGPFKTSGEFSYLQLKRVELFQRPTANIIKKAYNATE